jgi:hypothetical protein
VISVEILSVSKVSKRSPDVTVDPFPLCH